MVAITMISSTLLPRNFSFANAKPASEQRMTTEIVQTEATIRLLISA